LESVLLGGKNCPSVGHVHKKKMVEVSAAGKACQKR